MCSPIETPLCHLSPHQSLSTRVITTVDCVAGDHNNDGEWTFFGGMRRDAKIWTEEDGGSHETAEISLVSTEAAGGVPDDDVEMRLFFKYGDEYHR